MNMQILCVCNFLKTFIYVGVAFFFSNNTLLHIRSFIQSQSHLVAAQHNHVFQQSSAESIKVIEY